MGFHDITKRAPGLLILWIFAIILIFMIIILYIIQTQYLRKNGAGATRTPSIQNADIIRNFGNAISGLGIAMCVTGAIWIILLVGLQRNLKNINADASSIYVSRSNILANFFIDGTGQPITGNAPPIDGTSTCFDNFQVSDSPQAYDAYRKMIAAYQKEDGTVKQSYESFTSTGFSDSPGASTYSRPDTMENQRRLSLGYYRYLYCTKAYYQDILNGVGIQQMDFLSPIVKQNLQAKPQVSSCNPDSHIPDTQACLEGGQPGTSSCKPNLCYNALIETISAQCLFYDDHVYKLLNPQQPALGVLASMQITGAPMGYRVRASPADTPV